VARSSFISAQTPYAVARLGIAAVLALGLILSPGAAAPAGAETAAEAHRAAQRAAADLQELDPRLQAARTGWELSLEALRRGVSASVSADATADASVALDSDARTDRVNQVRALYMSGGTGALYGTLFASGTLTDVVARAHSVHSVLHLGSRRAAVAGTAARADAGRAADLDVGVQAQVVVADEVRARWAEVSALVTAQEQRLAVLAAHAGALDAAEAAEARAAAERAAALRASLAATTATAASGARARVAPAAYRDLYRHAAATCPGMAWTLLSAVGQVESGHGINVGPSSAGALGPMQFLPATFAAYGVDGDRDGDRDVSDPADAIFSAATYLCAGGGGGDRPATSRALYRYNHAGWYVTLVLGIADQLAATP
jgi:hypothetical protein